MKSAVNLTIIVNENSDTNEKMPSEFFDQNT